MEKLTYWKRISSTNTGGEMGDGSWVAVACGSTVGEGVAGATVDNVVKGGVVNGAESCAWLQAVIGNTIKNSTRVSLLLECMLISPLLEPEC